MADEYQVPALYRVRCVTEGTYVYTEGYVLEPPTKCPNNGDHQIDPESVVLIEQEPVIDTVTRAVEDANTGQTQAIEAEIAQVDAKIDDTRDDLNSKVQTLVQQTRETNTLRCLPILPGGTAVAKRTERVCAFLWKGGFDGSPTQFVYIRGMARKYKDEGTLYVTVFDLDENKRIGREEFEFSGHPKTFDIKLDHIVREQGNPYPIEIYLQAEKNFLVESCTITEPIGRLITIPPTT